MTPPLGWNSFGCNVSEMSVRQAADAIAASGMRDVGYQYVVVDDCWFDPRHDAQGNLRASPLKFPGGMKALGDHTQGLGLKFGIYQVPTERTFASWGLDYVKYDWCSPAGTRDEQAARFGLMRDALRATGRPIVYSINPNGYHDDDNVGAVADLWRTTEDLLDVCQGKANSYPMDVGNVLDADRQGTTNGTRVVSWACTGQSSQKWVVGPDGSIQNVHSGLCLDDEGAGAANGAHVIRWSCNGQPNQKWARA